MSQAPSYNVTQALAVQALVKVKQDYEEASAIIGKVKDYRDAFNALELLKQRFHEIKEGKELPEEISRILERQHRQANPIDVLDKVWKFHRDPQVDAATHAQAVNAAIYKFVEDIGLDLVAPREFEKIKNTLAVASPETAIGILNANYSNWQKLRWAIQDGLIHDEAGYWRWKQSGMKYKWRLSRWLDQFDRNYPPERRPVMYELNALR